MSNRRSVIPANSLLQLRQRLDRLPPENSERATQMSTGRTILLLEEHGVETVQGLIKSPKDLLRKQNVNRWLSRWRLDQPRLLREPPAVRFQAENSND